MDVRAPSPLRPAIIALMSAIVLFFAVNIIGSTFLRGIRLDLTSDRRFTPSAGMDEIIASLERPVRLRLFLSARLSDRLPWLRIHGERVRILLNEIVAASNGMVRLEIIDPEPYSEAEDLAVQAGLSGIPADGTGQQIYFGLVGDNDLDAEATIPFFREEREAVLEYDIARLLSLLDGNDSLPLVGVTGSIDLGGQTGNAFPSGGATRFAIADEIGRRYTLVNIGDGQPVPGDVSLLLVLHPRDIPPAGRHAIDQFVLRGGHTLVLVDPHYENEPRIPSQEGIMLPSFPTSSGLPDLFRAWGIEMPPEQFVADREQAIAVQAPGLSRRSSVDYIAWFGARGDSLSQDDVVTYNLDRVNLISAGSLKPLPDAGTEIRPLITSSADSSLLPASLLDGRPDPERLLAEFTPDAGRHIIAARISGPARSAFDAPPEGSPVAPEDHITESRGSINVVVVADADFLSDAYWVQRQELLGQEFLSPFADNGNFLSNLTDNLAGSGALISMRTRGSTRRPFTRLEAIRRKADQAMLAREYALNQSLEETQRKLSDLQRQAGQDSVLPGAGEQEMIAEFRKSVLSLRQELRDLQLSLNREIRQLTGLIKFINIVLVPLLVALAFPLLLLQARRRRRRACLRLSGAASPLPARP